MTALWDSADASGVGVFGRTFFAGGSPSTMEYPLNTTTEFNQEEPRIAATPGGFVAVWGNLGTSESFYRLATVDTVDGTVQLAAEQALTSATGAIHPDVDVAADGSPMGPKVRVNDCYFSSQRNPDMAGDGDGVYVVSWDQTSDLDGDEDGVVARLYGPPVPGSTSTTTTTTGTTLFAPSCGDPNGDGKITAGDALAALLAAVGAIGCDPCLCDSNGSGGVTSGDALLILLAAVGQPVSLDCPAC